MRFEDSKMNETVMHLVLTYRPSKQLMQDSTIDISHIVDVCVNKRIF